MKKTMIVFSLAALILLSGCAPKSQEAEQKQGENTEKQAASEGYLPGMVDIKNQAQQKINDAVEKENAKIQKGYEDAGLETKIEDKSETGEADEALSASGAVLKTSLGDIKIKFYANAAPLTVKNFVKLAQENFYDGVKFHRVIKGFMIQGGDPNSKTGAVSTWGAGGPGYKFADELTGKEKYPQGTVAMANSGPDTNGSQFFIVTASPAATLPPSYTVFGEVIAGMENALKIENVQTAANDRPVEAVIIKSVELVK